MDINNKVSLFKIVTIVSTTFLALLADIEGLPNNNELRTKRQTKIDDVGTYVGCLVKRSHKVSGKVYYIKQTNQLYIKDFTFDGLGFGTYFYVALEGTKRPFSRKNSVAVNWPDPLSEVRTPIEKAFNKQDIVINIPADIDGEKILWLSLWCEQFRRSFGDVVFKSNNPKENACAPGAKKVQSATLANLQQLAINDPQLAEIITPLLTDPSRQEELQQLLLKLQDLQS